MPDTSPIGNVIRNVLAVRRFGNGLAYQGNLILRQLFDDLAAQIQRSEAVILAWEPLVKDTARNRALQSFLKEIDEEILSSLNELRSMQTEDLRGLFSYQAIFSERLLTQQLGGVGVDIVPARVGPFMAKAVVERNPFQGKILKDWFDDLGHATMSRVHQQLKLGLLQNETIDDMVRRIRGRMVRRATKTRPGVYRGGVMETTTREARTIVRTAATDVATQAHLQTYRANEDITKEFEYLATLDLVTTVICADLDGQVFAYDDPEARFPPQHMNCRSAILPVIDWAQFGITPPPEGMRASMDGPVSAKTNFDGWLKDQPFERQAKVLGIGKAKMYARGDISLRDLVRSDGGIVTLKELKKAAG